MKLLLTVMLVLAVAVVPALAQQDKSPSSGTSEPSKPDGGTSPPSASPGSAPSASPGTANAPTNTDDCKDDGWSKFTSPKFMNQGECVSWVEKQEKSK